MSQKAKLADQDDDPWESGELGRSMEHAEVVADEPTEKMIDEALSLQPISIRLEKGLIDAFKLIASRNKNIGYQTLMRQALKRFATGEIKRIANQMAAEVRASDRAQKEASAAEDDTDKPKAA